MILKIIASVLTGIGGHYLNRRWDKAILFLCLMIFSSLFTYGIIIFSFQSMVIENIYFGGAPSNAYNLPAPPEGSGQFKGKILFHQKPAEGIRLDIVLNSKYRAKNIITDNQGVFTVNLPAGQWWINSIQCESWENKLSKGNYTLYYGGEKKFDGNNYNRYTNFHEQGYKAVVSKDSDNIHITLRINPDIQMIWPDIKQERLKATIQDTIRWEKYPGATQYHVKITKIRKEGTTTYFEPITTRTILNDNALKLSSLEHIKTTQKEKPEYGVEIFCFAEDGTLMGEVAHMYLARLFCCLMAIC